MQHQKRKVIAMLFLLSIAGAFNVPAEGGGDNKEIEREKISQYKSWLKVTPRPHRVELTIDGVDS
jgi:hypothetical protein